MGNQQLVEPGLDQSAPARAVDSEGPYACLLGGGDRGRFRVGLAADDERLCRVRKPREAPLWSEAEWMCLRRFSMKLGNHLGFNARRPS